MKKHSNYGMNTPTTKRKCLRKPDTELAPWKIADANKKTTARLEAINHLLKSIPYE